MGKKPTVRNTDITPNEAAALLERNFRNNRPVNESRVAAYASDMESGNWTFTGESIKLDTNGEVIDGQHRLEAIVASGVTVPMLLVSGLDPRAMVNIDTQMGRTLRHVLALQSYDNPTELAGALSAVNVYESYMEDKVTQDRGSILSGVGYRDAAGKRPYRRFSNKAFTRTAALALLDRRPSLIESVAAMKPHCHGRKTTKVRPSVGMAALLHNIAADSGDGASVVEYVEAVRLGAGDVTDPVWQTHKILERNATATRGSDRLLPYRTDVAWFRGYEAYMNGETTKLRQPSLRSFPTIPGDVEWYLAGKEAS